MDEARAAAITAGDKTYIGKACTNDPEHGDERYASNGGCVLCAAASAAKHKAKTKPLMGEAEVQALLMRGGPNSRGQAQAAGLAWYNHPQGIGGYCHGIIGLNGNCPLCGQPTPEPVDSKDDLEIAQRMLS